MIQFVTLSYNVGLSKRKRVQQSYITTHFVFMLSSVPVSAPLCVCVDSQTGSREEGEKSLREWDGK